MNELTVRINFHHNLDTLRKYIEDISKITSNVDAKCRRSTVDGKSLLGMIYLCESGEDIELTIHSDYPSEVAFFRTIAGEYAPHKTRQ